MSFNIVLNMDSETVDWSWRWPFAFFRKAKWVIKKFGSRSFTFWSNGFELSSSDFFVTSILNCLFLIFAIRCRQNVKDWSGLRTPRYTFPDVYSIRVIFCWLECSSSSTWSVARPCSLTYRHKNINISRLFSYKCCAWMIIRITWYIWSWNKAILLNISFKFIL